MKGMARAQKPCVAGGMPRRRAAAFCLDVWVKAERPSQEPTLLPATVRAISVYFLSSGCVSSCCMAKSSQNGNDSDNDKDDDKDDDNDNDNGNNVGNDNDASSALDAYPQSAQLTTVTVEKREP